MREQNLKLKSYQWGCLLLGLFAISSFASITPITCSTNFDEKSFTIEGQSVAFHQERSDGRSISSVVNSATRKSHKGFRKTLYRDGKKILISIHNTRHFSSDNDFLAITSPKGHKMTFPLNCNLLE